MNHPFQAAAWNKQLCSKCLSGEAVHGDSVTCESCNNVGLVEKIGKLFLCESCAKRENNTPDPVKINKEEQTIEKFVERINKAAESSTVKNVMDAAIQGNIKQYRDFFNAKIPSIVELKELIDANNEIIAGAKDEKEILERRSYALAKALQARVTYLTMVLFNLRGSEIELSAEVKSIQFYVKDLIPQLRLAKQAEFAAITPNYTPVVVKQTAPKSVKKNAQDKLAESYAKMMNISFEQAQRLLANKLRDECSCSETPGMCKVHS